MLTLLPSADHELYLGENRLPEDEVLLHPTRALLDRCGALDLPLTLFTDLCCWERYRALGRIDFAEAVLAQLRGALAQGHDVQAHVHPHWRIAQPEGASWRFPPRAYAMTPAEAPDLLAHARLTLETWLRPVQPDYRCRAFRAGGYALQPHAGAIFAALREGGYLLDSSLIPDYRLNAPTHQVDFSHLPHGGRGWFGPTHGLTQNVPPFTGIFEIPIPGVTLPPDEARGFFRREALAQAWRVLWNRPRGPVRGVPAHGASPGEAPPAPLSRMRAAWWRYHGVVGQTHLRLELNQGADTLLAGLDRYLDRHGEGHPMLSLNMHPKGMGPWHLKTLSRLVEKIRQRWGDQVRFLTFAQAASLVESTGANPEKTTE